MKQLVEINNGRLGELKLKYLTINLFKENNITDSNFNIASLFDSHLKKCFDFTHNLLEAYFIFKSALEDLESTLPLTSKFDSQALYFDDLIVESNLSSNLLDSLGFEYFLGAIPLDFEDDSSVEQFRELFNSFNVNHLVSYLDDECEAYYSRYILCHPLLDKLMLSSDYAKISTFENFINSNSNDLSLFIRDFETQIASNASVLSVEDIIDSPDWGHPNEIKNFKYGIVINCLACYNSYEYNSGSDDIDYDLILCAILKLCLLLK